MLELVDVDSVVVVELPLVELPAVVVDILSVVDVLLSTYGQLFVFVEENQVKHIHITNRVEYSKLTKICHSLSLFGNEFSYFDSISNLNEK